MNSNDIAWTFDDCAVSVDGMVEAIQDTPQHEVLRYEEIHLADIYDVVELPDGLEAIVVDARIERDGTRTLRLITSDLECLDIATEYDDEIGA